MLENFKKRIQARIERNAVESDLIYTRRGEEIRERVYLKRSKLPVIGDWGRIYPPITPNGNINWINLVFGGYKNFIKLCLIFLVLALLYYQVSGILGANKEFMNGDKYVIIEKEAFNKFCQTAIQNTEKIEVNNMTFYKSLNFTDG